eukprot:m.187670 g.187670  ORF g.187670 m.187670 type:complete len:567 (+) comp16933_c0_seq1:2496-4196(+)
MAVALRRLIGSRWLKQPVQTRYLHQMTSHDHFMSDYPLTLPSFTWRAENLFGDKTMITDHGDGPPVVTKYSDYVKRCRKVGGILEELNVKPGGRVGSFAWSSGDHMDLWFGVPNANRVLHTINIRLFAEQIKYVVNHAENEVLFVDRSLVALLWPLVDSFKTVRNVVVMDDGAGEIPDDPRILMYDNLLASAKEVEFAASDELMPASMCYTSGTSGMPKAVVYTHRSQWLHTVGVMVADGGGIYEKDVILPVVPQFHANAWGYCHACVACGSTLLLPGRGMTPSNLARLMEEYKVTLAAGVPTIWTAVLPELEGRDLTALRSLLVGGSPLPNSLSQAYKAATGLHLLPAWGMTETSPMGAICQQQSRFADATEEEQDDLRRTVGYPVVGVEARIVNLATNEVLPWDGQQTGELEVRGPWVASAYYKPDTEPDCFQEDGWMATGDVASITEHGYIQIHDRSKDLIKSGGEWIGSVEVENIIMGHPKVQEAAVIGVTSSKWMERPLACVVLHEGAELTHPELIEYLSDKMAKWWLPDAMEVVEEVPKTSVGKFDKKVLRTMFKDMVLE